MERPAYTRVALTGTPGTGKSTVGRLLQRNPAMVKMGFHVTEVSDLAVRSGGGRPIPGPRPTVEVDLDQLSRWLGAEGAGEPPLLIVGHLAHLLPVEASVLLRCDPVILEQRLQARGDPVVTVQQNVESEMVDVILAEAVGAGYPLFEHDTTRETPSMTAQWVLSVIEGKVAPSHGEIDWLAHFVGEPAREGS